MKMVTWYNGGSTRTWSYVSDDEIKRYCEKLIADGCTGILISNPETIVQKQVSYSPFDKDKDNAVPK